MCIPMMPRDRIYEAAHDEARPPRRSAVGWSVRAERVRHGQGCGQPCPCHTIAVHGPPPAQIGSGRSGRTRSNRRRVRRRRVLHTCFDRRSCARWIRPAEPVTGSPPPTNFLSWRASCEQVSLWPTALSWQRGGVATGGPCRRLCDLAVWRRVALHHRKQLEKSGRTLDFALGFKVYKPIEGSKPRDVGDSRARGGHDTSHRAS